TDADRAGKLRAPRAWAHDRRNVYVADPHMGRTQVLPPGEEMMRRDCVLNGARFDVRAHGSLEGYRPATRTQEGKVGTSGQEHKFDLEEVPVGTTAAQLRDMFVNKINNREGTLVTAQAMNGPGTLARALIKFTGDTRAGDIITLNIGDRSYSVEMLGAPADP